MKQYTFEVTKRIVVTVEAETEDDARTAIMEDMIDGEYSYPLYSADAELRVIHVSGEV